jgi:hypothetical protein
MSKAPDLRSDQSGQALVEFVLLTVITLSVAMVVMNFVRKNAPDLINKPWGTLTGMIECGTWTACKPGLHPSSLERVLSYKPTD